jgi:hypothetical protein
VHATIANKQNSAAEVRGLGAQGVCVGPSLLLVFIHIKSYLKLPDAQPSVARPTDTQPATSFEPRDPCPAYLVPTWYASLTQAQ